MKDALFAGREYMTDGLSVGREYITDDLYADREYTDAFPGKKILFVPRDG